MKRIINQVPIEKIIKAFANKRRIEMLKLLHNQPELSVEHISANLKMEYKITAAHLSKLSIGGLIIKRYMGHTVLHKLTSRGEKVLKFVRILE